MEMKRLALPLHEAALLLKRVFECESRDHHLTITQWRILGIVSAKGPRTQSELATMMTAKAMTISDAAERLESRGLVTRHADPSDSRAKQVHLTEAGAALIALTRERMDKIGETALKGIAEADLEVTIRVLYALIGNLDEGRAAQLGCGPTEH
ncbi:MarR family transcriptional regulator [Pseudooceanicola sp. CBS1P-1]|uniref:MarR family transcriptional regulator n=1 Tax=Pseudooceanicola albus TaxID=2692189 RepID=A0A6L7G486_9RHOB|nr:MULTISPECIES: MarR family transcriptional regulator [Pseudooceanicola]MBT9385666.1 MarR family transcriptional regulator [Pseudooceanicola endophyticus]MXN18925.1 MarR family transcriptional regulator [Pseudooceanicola albus]